MAFRAEGAFFKAARRVRTKPGNGTGELVGTVIERMAEAAGFLKIRWEWNLSLQMSFR